MKRESGVLLPVFSLPGPYGCGTMGQNAFDFIDFLAGSGFSWWQVLPLGLIDAYRSPYASCSSFGGEPLWIDPGELYKRDLITKAELDGQVLDSPYLCDYDGAGFRRLSMLKKAAARIRDKREIEQFLNDYPVMKDACRFFALRALNGGRHFKEWTVTEPDEETLFAWQFIQCEFHRQWRAVHNYAKKKGVSIMGDLPFYVASDSFDLWSRPDLFQLDARRDPAFVAGVPPDYFSEDGQKWGNPLYDWKKMKQNGYAYWKERLSYVLSLYDGVRIDHFRALSAYWRIPADAETAKDGAWIKGPGNDFIDAIRPLTKDKTILAEDLGIIDDDTRALLKYSGFPGMAVFQFGFDGDPGNTHLPHNYCENLAAYSGTHDNNTLLGFWFEAPEAARAEASAYLADPRDPCRAILAALWMSKARLVVAPVQDLLGYGADTRINTPGKAEGNWRYRVTAEQLRNLDPKRLAAFNRLYGR